MIFRDSTISKSSFSVSTLKYLLQDGQGMNADADNGRPRRTIRLPAHYRH